MQHNNTLYTALLVVQLEGGECSASLVHIKTIFHFMLKHQIFMC